MKSVAIVVVTYNSEELLSDLVASLRLGAAGVAWRLVVVDNDSIDRTVAVLAELAPDAEVVRMGRNAGYAAGINAAIARAGAADGYLVLNPDVRLRPGCLRTLLDALDQPGTGIAVPRLLDRQGELILSQRREPSLLRACGDLFLGAERAGRFPRLGEIVTDTRCYQTRATTDWAEGSTQLISARCWADCGPWDESFFLYSEETEFDLRARDRGWATRFEPAALAVHLEGGSADNAAMWSLLQLNRVRLFRRRNGLALGCLFWAATVAREATRAALGRKVSRAALASLVNPRRLTVQAGPHLL